MTGNGENQGACPLIAVEGGVADILLCLHQLPQGLVSVGVAQGLSIQQETERGQIWVWFSHPWYRVLVHCVSSLVGEGFELILEAEAVGELVNT